MSLCYNLGMLIQFSVENHLSINQEQIFSLLATSDTQHKSHLVSDVPRKSDHVLRAAAIYGANGAGKSSLVKAIKFAQDFISTGTRAGQAIPVRPFKLTQETGRSSKFEFIFQTKGVTYNYGFRVDSARVLEEWLFATPKTQEVLLFQRTTSKSGKVEIEFGNRFTGNTVKNKQFLQFVAQGTRPNQLFLTEAVERNVPAVQPISQWFERVLVVIPAEVRARGLEVGLHKSELQADFVKECLQAAGTGIDHISIEEVKFDLESLAPNLSSEDKERLLLEIAQLKPSEIIDITASNGKQFTLRKGNDGEPVRLLMKIYHRAVDGQLVSLDMDELSEGTQRFIHLIPALRMLKLQSEKVVVLDELDRRFHTLLSRFFIQAALNCDKEHPYSQLIFTTHDTNLLDLELLRRDEIWFIEKDKAGASHLYSLAEFKVRPDLKIEKGYLNGRFGAIPFATDLTSLGWASQESSKAETCG